MRAEELGFDLVFGLAQWLGKRGYGGNVHLVGTPEQIVEHVVSLKQAGCDGVQVNFYDYLPDLEYFGSRLLPLMKQAGLRLRDDEQAAPT